MSSYKTILMFGAPGVGKGTQGKLLGCIPGFHHLATGDMFRALDRSSSLGRKFLEHSSRGELVPDELTVELWQQTMERRIGAKQYAPDRDLLVLDGIPRSVAQAAALDPHIDVLAIVHLAARCTDEMVSRMKRRAMIENRHDDADESVIRRRFEVYERETAPVLGHYGREVIHEIDPIGTPARVLNRVLEVVAPLYERHFANPLVLKA